MTAVSNGILRSSLRDQVLAVLRQRLVSGELKPGEIYSAQAVAAELGVSGSPVREAMLTLVNQGLMEPVRNRGFLVVATSERERADIYEMRLWLEVPAMAKLAGRPDLVAAQSVRFRMLVDQLVSAAKTGDVVEFLDKDREFHLGLTELLESARLTTIIADLRDQTRLYGLEILKAQGALVHSAVEHLGILEALLAGDADESAKLMTAHISHVMADWAG